MDNEARSSAPSGTSGTSTPSRTQAPPVPLYSGSSERQAVQVIQQAIHRPPSMAAQYLQQMYAAQQQHLMLQTAALQQQQQQQLSSSQLQSLATVQQATLSGGRQSSSPTGSVTQQSSVSQTSINLSTSPAATQLISRTQTSSSSGSGGLTQQTMLLGSSSPTLTTSQAQMYLRAQMLILTPTATVTAVQSDLPVVSSASSQSTVSQVQNLAVRTHQANTQSSGQNTSVKTSTQGQTLPASHPKMSLSPVKASPAPDSHSEGSKKGDSPGAEPRSGTINRLSATHHLIAPVYARPCIICKFWLADVSAPYPSMQPQALIKHQPLPLYTSPPAQKGNHHQLIIQQSSLPNRQVQPVAIQVSTQETPSSSQPCVSVQTQVSGASSPMSAQSQNCTVVSSSPSQPQQQTVVVSPQPPPSPTSPSQTIIIQPQTIVQAQTQALISSPVQQAGLTQATVIPSLLPPVSSPVVQSSTLPQTPLLSQTSVSQSPQLPLPPQTAPPSTSLTQLAHTPTATLQPLPLQSVQALAMQSEILTPGQMLVSQEELPAAEALVQMPFQSLSPPQTVAVNLQVQSSAQVEAPVVYQIESICQDELREDRIGNRTPTPPALSPPAAPVEHNEEMSERPENDTDPLDLQCVTTCGNASVIRSAADPSYVSSSPPCLQPAPVQTSCKPTSASLSSGAENRPPQAIVKPQILTHLIEGFVIQEGLEPFPVSRSSLLIENQAKVSKEQGIKQTSVEPPALIEMEQPENSTDSEMDDMITEEGIEDAVTKLLKCEFCGKMGYAHKFLRSKRFCSMSCAKRHMQL
ncbi:polyhomeotic-like protein 3 isoform X5 [Polypterus senegalus]|uniref:polyhomeotic-like protein 3 isoform X5 n=1 Tax=Polypterus senegalus TaxID=55291 RepID=UPI0019636215|nr:polyhomeotic-like protein 3 isoform X5 [Polypterus senegalus]